MVSIVVAALSLHSAPAQVLSSKNAWEKFRKFLLKVITPFLEVKKTS
jgi:hypothetical protein